MNVFLYLKGCSPAWMDLHRLWRALASLATCWKFRKRVKGCLVNRSLTCWRVVGFVKDGNWRQVVKYLGVLLAYI